MTPTVADGSLTAFYVQESTADAYFDTDDDEVCIPFVEGSAIYFNGGLPHRSIVKSGAVKLVGPFLLKGLEAVGVGSSPTRIPTRPPTGPPTRSPTTPPTTFPTASPTTSKASKVKASKAPKVAVGESTSTLQVQKMTSGGSSVPQTSLAGVWLVSLLSLGAFFSF